jgi:hypothetical protein
LGCEIHTITNHANRLFPGKIRNGVRTYFDEREVTLILESIRNPTPSGAKSNLVNEIQGIDTALTPALRLEMLYRQIDEIKNAELAKLKQERDALQIRCDTHETYLTVKRVAKLNGIPWNSLDWKAVKRSSAALELEWVKADDLNYGSCNAYHIDAWRDAYPSLRYEGGAE